ncbi:MAG: zf-HC2 domain-containing protein [Vicinamibacterales bacterium]
MLSCREVGGLSSDYLNRDLPWRRRLAVRLHLLMCEGCSRYYRQMKTTLALLRTIGSGKSTSTEDTPTASAARDWFRSGRP